MKTIFNGRRPLMKDDLLCMTTFAEDDLLWKMTFDGRRPLTPITTTIKWVLTQLKLAQLHEQLFFQVAINNYFFNQLHGIASKTLKKIYPNYHYDTPLIPCKCKNFEFLLFVMIIDVKNMGIS